MMESYNKRLGAGRSLFDTWQGKEMFRPTGAHLAFCSVGIRIFPTGKVAGA